MSGPAAPRSRPGGGPAALARRWAWALPAAGTLSLSGVLAWAAVRSAHHPGWLWRAPQWWWLALRPGAPWTLPVLAGLWAAAVALYWWPRRGEGSNAPVFALLSMVAVGTSLGAASFLPCAGGQAPVVAPLSWVLMLFTGSLEPRFGPGTGCPGQLPLALQMARTVCLGATFAGVAAAAAVLWRHEIDRLKARFLSELTTLTGLDTMSLALLGRLAPEGGSRPVVVVEADPGHPLLEEARATGARAIVGDPTRRGPLRAVLTHLGRCSVRRVFVLHSGAQLNEAILAASREVIDGAKRRPGTRPHIVVRVDDPRHADTWRGRHILPHQYWLEDAISPYETTAASIMKAVLARTVGILIVCGDTTLALSILIEAGRCAWERQERAAAQAASASPGAGRGRRPAFPSIVVMAERAADLRREFFATASARIGQALPAVDIAPVQWRKELLPALDAMTPAAAESCAVVITDEPTPEIVHEAGRVARLHPRTAIHARSGDDGQPVGVAFDQLHLFQLGFLVDGVLPEDTWTRLARHNHECYRLRWPAAEGSLRELARRRWDELDGFFRDENIRQIRQILSDAVQLGRVWRPTRTVSPGSMVEFTASEALALARAEHGHWLQWRLHTGWRPPAESERADDRRRLNARVVPWETLTDVARRENVQQVRSILERLEAVGYLPALPDGGPGHAAVYTRRGEVRAFRMTAPRDWATADGRTMRAEAGDWHIQDAMGHIRTARDSEFRATHRHAAGDRWARTGRVRAWQVAEDTMVRTLEGPAVAEAGDWIVEGPSGARWPVPADRFEHGHRQVPLDR